VTEYPMHGTPCRDLQAATPCRREQGPGESAQGPCNQPEQGKFGSCMAVGPCRVVVLRCPCRRVAQMPMTARRAVITPKIMPTRTSALIMANIDDFSVVRPIESESTYRRCPLKQVLLA
jgi:hypothetical protein